ncbi:MAG: metallophosphoesterase [Acidobacteriota bacterium]
MRRRDAVAALVRSAPATILGTGAAGGVYAFGYEPSALSLERKTISLRRLPGDFHGMTIALLTDLHVGPFTRASFVAKACRLAMDAKPDLVVLGGDYVHRSPRYFEPCVEALADLRAPLGVFAVTGNHDHWEGIDAGMRAFHDAPIAFLRNGAKPIERGACRLWISGVDDLMTRNADPIAALGPIPAGECAVLVSHNPDLAEMLDPQKPVDLVLSGHTHGGQVNIPLLGSPVVPSRYGQKYAGGLVENPANKVYVSRGVGTISPPVRFRCAPEVSLLTLEAAG